jgi:hypothetical protein
MAYVDLNPVRAGIAETPETSHYTSIQARLEALAEAPEPEIATTASVPAGPSPAAALAGETLRSEAEAQALPKVPLMPFDATARTPWAVPFAFEDYLELVDWTGRALRADKRGRIAAQQPAILDRLNIDGACFITYADRLLKVFGNAIGAPAALTAACARRQTKYLRGVRAARELFAPKLAA